MQGLSVRVRLALLAAPIVALVVTTAVVSAGAEREPLTGDVVVLLGTGILLVFAAPLGLLSVLVRTRVGWIVSTVFLTGLSIAAPLVVEAMSEESSTGGLALLIVPFYGSRGVIVVGVTEAIARRRS